VRMLGRVALILLLNGAGDFLERMACLAGGTVRWPTKVAVTSSDCVKQDSPVRFTRKSFGVSRPMRAVCLDRKRQTSERSPADRVCGRV